MKLDSQNFEIFSQKIMNVSEFPASHSLLFFLCDTKSNENIHESD